MLAHLSHDWVHALQKSQTPTHIIIQDGDIAPHMIVCIPTNYHCLDKYDYLHAFEQLQESIESFQKLLSEFIGPLCWTANQDISGEGLGGEKEFGQ